MKDRQPTQVLANGAIRYGVYNADGTLNHYEYLKREDAPTVEGTHSTRQICYPMQPPRRSGPARRSRTTRP